MLVALPETVDEALVMVVWAFVSAAWAAVKSVWQVAVDPPAAATAFAEHAVMALLRAKVAELRSAEVLPVALLVLLKLVDVVFSAVVMVVTVPPSLYSSEPPIAAQAFA